MDDGMGGMESGSRVYLVPFEPSSRARSLARVMDDGSGEALFSHVEVTGSECNARAH